MERTHLDYASGGKAGRRRIVGERTSICIKCNKKIDWCGFERTICNKCYNVLEPTVPGSSQRYVDRYFTRYKEDD